MFIPPRPERGTDRACTRTPRFLAAVTVGAVALGATLGIVPSAAADPEPGAARTLFVDIVGDSYLAGEGITETYLDPADPRHRSLSSPALQALSRVASENPGLRVDANVVASSGAVTADYFQGQQDDADKVLVNTAQHVQIRPNAQVVIVGFGGNDAELARVLSTAKPSNKSEPGDLDSTIDEFDGLLDTSASDETYLEQATNSPLGEAPTLVARMLQVLAAVSERAPNARIVVTNYPVGVDPNNPHSAALIKKRDLVAVQKYVFDLNGALERAIEICRCANLVDLSKALHGREAYTKDSAYSEPTSGQPHDSVPIQPSEQGASLMADPIAQNLATVLGMRRPKPSGDRATMPENIAARSAESDVDGDLVPDHLDEAPTDRNDHRIDHDRHRGDSGHRDQPRSGGRHDRQRPPRLVDVQAVPDLLAPVITPRRPAVERVSAQGGRQRHRNGMAPSAERNRRPGGNIPVDRTPPPAPAPKRESEPNQLPEDRAAAEADAAERTPGRFDWWASDGGSVGEVVPEPSREEQGRFRPRVPAEEPTEQPATEKFGYERRTAAEEPVTEESAVDGFGYERRTLAEEPATEGLGYERRTSAEEPAAEGLGYERPAPTEEPAEQPTDQSFAPQRSAPAEESSDRPAPVEEVAPEPPVAPAPVTEAPPAERPVEEASDGQQVCILIYPAPAGCGGSEQEGGAS